MLCSNGHQCADGALVLSHSAASPSILQRTPALRRRRPRSPTSNRFDTSSTNGLAIASMVLGIVWVWWIGSILALIFGFVARKQIRESGQRGDGMAIAGIVLGCVGVVTLILVIVLVIAGVHRTASFNFGN